ncbi:MAG: hypothetical protein PHT27_08120, partial [Candidatus Izemoplasmatales bacterium]|nr:hypothetical protein [Candidatus Izemoplasmatales bacterium]
MRIGCGSGQKNGIFGKAGPNKINQLGPEIKRRIRQYPRTAAGSPLACGARWLLKPQILVDQHHPDPVFRKG